jgi:hypothetical protein
MSAWKLTRRSIMTSPAQNPSQGDMKLFYFVLKHCKTKPDVDWSLVAADCGFKNADVAKASPPQPHHPHFPDSHI